MDKCLPPFRRTVVPPFSRVNQSNKTTGPRVREDRSAFKIKATLKVNVKVTLTGHEGPEVEQRYSSILSLTSALDGDGWSTPRPGRFTPGRNPVPIVQEAGWVPGPVWTGAENLASNGIRSPDRPARSESPYRLRYPSLQSVIYCYVFVFI